MKKRLTVKLGKKERGFTLIELLIVIAILGVLAAVVVPNVMGLFGRGGNQAYDSDKQTIQTAVASFWGDVHQGPDIVQVPPLVDDPTDNVWGEYDAVPDGENLGTGHYFPTATASNTQDVGGTLYPIMENSAVVDPDNPENPSLEINGVAVTDAQVSAVSIWMGLLVNNAATPVALGEADRGLAAPWIDPTTTQVENELYLTEFPNSSSHEITPAIEGNGNPDTPGGTYTWIVGQSGRVFGAYESSAGVWYSGFSGNYP
jgi:type IV pilus assembly protein PilA